MTQSRITIEDVAKAAQVSRQTVSRVLNRSPKVSAKARERVEAAIADLGYVPNMAARRMGGARSFLVLAVLERGAGTAGAGARTGRLPLDAMLVAGLDRCSEAGYHLLFEQLGTDPAESLAQLNRTLTALSPDGVILTPPLEERADLRSAIEGRGIALEDLGHRRAPGEAGAAMDDAALGEEATRRLCELGHRQIGFVTGSADPRRSEKRLAGYHRVMAAKGSRAHHHFTADGRRGFAEALGLAKSWLVPTIRPTAIIAETEEVALAVLDVARELGVEVPHELSLLSLEDRASLGRADPPISALFAPYARAFGEGCARLIARAEGSETALQVPADGDADGDEVSPFEFAERASLAKAPRTL
ncbi:MAG: LacI family DNA-binding transcriptional regulator [Erythrobacter sp.]|uniref:LacI family DNA-binding transcriptional regulator n=1 Tax=Erythrobacter sp. TaxID=1042 RepID=UPI00261C3ACB|nr:LacI family DNA-binding transcriptional regulator [Erythrobacter sp.]MDJ0979598.1 LacI family DNA-binding transcriptional regulator [Erythrobacter sp.]